MCVVSMIGDHFHDKWGDKWPPQQPLIPPYEPQTVYLPPEITKKEFEDLKKEVLEMKALLKRAKIYDEEHDQKDCEMEDKVKFLRQVAEAVGVDLDEIFGSRGGLGTGE